MSDVTAAADGPLPAKEPRLGWRVTERPPPGFAHVLGAAAGGFAVVAMVAFIVEVASDDPTTAGVLFALGFGAVAVVAGFRAPGPVRSACVTTVVFCVPILWFFALLTDGPIRRGDVRLVYILTAASYVLLYLLTWTRGRAILLAAALVFLASWITFEVGNQSSSVIPFQDRIDNSQLGGSALGDSFSTASSTTDSQATTALVIGLVFLGVGTVLDRKRLAGAATPFVAVGAIETIAGAVVLGGNDSVLLGGVLAVGAGAVVGLVGGRGDRRRATTWIGVLTVFGGLVAILVDIAPDSAGGVGGIALGFAAALGVIAWFLAPRLGEPDDGDDRPVPPAPPPTPGDSTPSDPVPDDTTVADATEPATEPAPEPALVGGGGDAPTEADEPDDPAPDRPA